MDKLQKTSICPFVGTKLPMTNLCLDLLSVDSLLSPRKNTFKEQSKKETWKYWYFVWSNGENINDTRIEAQKIYSSKYYRKVQEQQLSRIFPSIIAVFFFTLISANHSVMVSLNVNHLAIFFSYKTISHIFNCLKFTSNSSWLLRIHKSCCC